MEWNESQCYTAWDLAGDWGWIDAGYDAMIAGGRTHYEEVTATGNDAVRLSRLQATTIHIHQVNRYVDPETKMYLVKPRPANATQ